ncbi:hypothetical protein GCM10020254_88290 [Streptomyces goshikiensis]
MVSGAFSRGSDSQRMTSRTVAPSHHAARNRPVRRSAAACDQNGSACSLVIWPVKWLASRSAPSSVSAWAMRSIHIRLWAWATPWVSKRKVCPIAARDAIVAA